MCAAAIAYAGWRRPASTPRLALQGVRSKPSPPRSFQDTNATRPSEGRGREFRSPPAHEAQWVPPQMGPPTPPFRGERPSPTSRAHTPHAAPGPHSPRAHAQPTPHSKTQPSTQPTHPARGHPVSPGPPARPTARSRQVRARPPASCWGGPPRPQHPRGVCWGQAELSPLSKARGGSFVLSSVRGGGRPGGPPAQGPTAPPPPHPRDTKRRVPKKTLLEGALARPRRTIAGPPQHQPQIVQRNR